MLFSQFPFTIMQKDKEAENTVEKDSKVREFSYKIEPWAKPDHKLANIARLIQMEKQHEIAKGFTAQHPDAVVEKQAEPKTDDGTIKVFTTSDEKGYAALIVGADGSVSVDGPVDTRHLSNAKKRANEMAEQEKEQRHKIAAAFRTTEEEFKRQLIMIKEYLAEHDGKKFDPALLKEVNGIDFSKLPEAEQARRGSEMYQCILMWQKDLKNRPEESTGILEVLARQKLFKAFAEGMFVDFSAERDEDGVLTLRQQKVLSDDFKTIFEGKEVNEEFKKAGIPTWQDLVEATKESEVDWNSSLDWLMKAANGDVWDPRGRDGAKKWLYAKLKYGKDEDGFKQAIETDERPSADSIVAAYLLITFYLRGIRERTDARAIKEMKAAWDIIKDGLSNGAPGPNEQAKIKQIIHIIWSTY